MIQSNLDIKLSKKNFKNVSEKVAIHHDLGNYQIILFVITNIGLFPTAASMLISILFEPSKVSFKEKNFHKYIFFRNIVKILIMVHKKMVLLGMSFILYL